MLSEDTRELIRRALEEDVSRGDLTTQATIPDHLMACGSVITREHCVVCGVEVVEEVFREIDPNIRFVVFSPDGTRIEPGTVIAEVRARCGAILTGERVALNFLQRLSGVATATHRVVEKTRKLGVRILDTRKTTPGWRTLEKYAVRVGGGANHRCGLHDAVLIKNNHVDALGGDIELALRRCRQIVPAGTRIEIEARNAEELKRCMALRPDAVLLDNMAPADLAEAVHLARKLDPEKLVELEASGGITEANVQEYARTGVDSLSLGSLTHSVVAVDISLRVRTDDPGL